MSIPQSLTDLAGEWVGTNLLWLADEPLRESRTTMTIETAARGRFAVMRYTWADEGEPQDGLLLVGRPSKKGGLEAVWIDSWHMGHGTMTLGGAPNESDEVSLAGSYAAPPGPDWGWRIEIVPDAGGFRLLMFNIAPDGEVYPAVEARYSRAYNGK